LSLIAGAAGLVDRRPGWHRLPWAGLAAGLLLVLYLRGVVVRGTLAIVRERFVMLLPVSPRSL
jgi:hypothetical protein